MKPFKVISACLLCSALLGCGSDSDSMTGGDMLADGVPSVGGEGSADTSAIAGLWLNVIGLEESEPPGYMEIFADGEYIIWGNYSGPVA